MSMCVCMSGLRPHRELTTTYIPAAVEGGNQAAVQVGRLEVEEDIAAQEGSLDSGQEDKLTRGREGGRGRERKRERRREGGRRKSQWDVTYTSMCMTTHRCSLNLWYNIPTRLCTCPRPVVTRYHDRKICP